jgi:Glycosyl hydrolases family 43/Concanavalin A-like lectin/glucanases superfamily
MVPPVSSAGRVSPAALASPVSLPALAALALAVVALLALCLPTTPARAEDGPTLRGDIGIHDPSTVIWEGNQAFVFGTGNGIVVHSSADGVTWNSKTPVFATPPAWTLAAVPDFTGFFWAPDIAYFNGKYNLYYSVSSWGTIDSAIGLATSPSLANPVWTDQGKVIQSDAVGYTDANTDLTANNCIDPSILVAANGTVWMVFGSYSDGILVMQLDPATGKRLYPATAPYKVASSSTSFFSNTTEGACLYQRGAYYYLFLNYGGCCSGIDSTYNIRVGRSTSPIGPFYDRSVVNLKNGGGTLFLASSGRFIGPGHMSIWTHAGREWFGCHYYDANNNGAPTHDIEPLSWTTDNWPQFSRDRIAALPFGGDLADAQGEHPGAAGTGATWRRDAERGTVLQFDGASQATLPTGAGLARTIDIVFRPDDVTTPWQRVFDFGQSTTRYAFFTPAGADGLPRFAIANGGAEQVLVGTQPLVAGAWTHATVTLNGTTGVLYLNGTAVASAAISLQLSDIVPTNSLLGGSQFATDPKFLGRIASLRTWGRALSAAEVRAPWAQITQPGESTRFAPGGTPKLAGWARDHQGRLLPDSALSWSVTWILDGVETPVAGPITGVAETSFTIPATGTASTTGFYRVALTATDGEGRSSVHQVDITPAVPATTAPQWSARFNFDNGGASVDGPFNATLVNSATTPTLATRGPVLSLASGTQHLLLPAEAGRMRTFAAWVKWNGGNAWQRIFDFGSGTTSYVFLTPSSGTGRPRLEILAPNTGGARQLDAPDAFPVGVWTHVAAVFHPNLIQLYINGKVVASQVAPHLLPEDLTSTTNYVGRSHFSSDPYFRGQMDSIVVSTRALTLPELVASSLDLASASNALTLSWPAWRNGLGLHQSTDLNTWTPVTTTPTTTEGIDKVSAPQPTDRAFYRLQFPE